MIGDAVVAQIGTAQGIQQGHRFARGHILVVELASGGHCQFITCDHVLEHGPIHRNRSDLVAVIRLIGRSDATQCDGFLADVSRGRSLVCDRVVAQIGTTEGVGQSDRFACGRILVAERASRGHFQLITHNHVVEHGIKN